MEFGPIVRALFRNKTRFWLISLEVALTLAVVVNCVNIIMDQRERILRPTGMDVDRLLVVESAPFAAEYEDPEYVSDAYERDLRAIRALPGVAQATSMLQIPLSGGGSATGRRGRGTEADTITVPYFVVGSDVVETLGIEIVEGRNFVPSDFDRPDDPESDDPDYVDRSGSNVLVTRTLADMLFPDGSALGGVLENRNGEGNEVIIGIIDHMHGSWPNSSVGERVMIYAGEPANARRTRYVVRADEGSVDDLYTALETELLRIDEGRITTVSTLAEIKARYYLDEIAINQLLLVLSVLLVAVTSLGIVGLTSFSVTQRTRQIGTRRALGASRLSIIRYFLLENWLVTGIGLTIGVGLTYGLNFVLAEVADAPSIELGVVSIGVAGMWLTGLVAALFPALKTLAVSPVVATRTI